MSEISLDTVFKEVCAYISITF